jgi:ketosteroid isomerase-like protein
MMSSVTAWHFRKISIAIAVGFYASFVSGAIDAIAADSTLAPNDAEDMAAVKQLESALGTAMSARDMGTLNRLYGDDWATILTDGHVMGKRELMSQFQSNNRKLVSFELGPIDVQISGDSAVALGTDTERRVIDGKRMDLTGAYMDFLKKRDGHWVLVRSMYRSRGAEGWLRL